MPDEEFLSSFRKRYALLQQKLAEAQRAQSKTEEEEDDSAPPSQAERLARARRNRLKMPELKDLRQQLTSKAVEHGHLPASMGASGEWSKFLPKADDAAEVKVASAAEAAGLPTVAAAQLAQMAAKREQQRQQHMEQLSQLNEQAEQMKNALHGTRAPGQAEDWSGMPAGLERHVGRLRQLQEQQGQVSADLQNLKGNKGNDRTQAPKGSPEMKGKGQRKGKAYGKWGPGKGYGNYQGGDYQGGDDQGENYSSQGPDYGGQEPDWNWGGWYPNQYQQWMGPPGPPGPPGPRGGPRYGRRGMQPRGMGQPMSPVQSQGLQGMYRSPAEMQAINGMNAVLQRVRGKTEVPTVRATQEVQPQTKAGAWGAAANEDAPAEAPAAGSGTGDVSTAAGAAQPIAEERRQSAASSADGKEKKEKKEKKDKDKDPSRKESKEKKKDPKEDEDPVGKTGSRAQKSWFGK